MLRKHVSVLYYPIHLQGAVGGLSLPLIVFEGRARALKFCATSEVPVMFF
jgi:hypothetical protein